MNSRKTAPAVLVLLFGAAAAMAGQVPQLPQFPSINKAIADFSPADAHLKTLFDNAITDITRQFVMDKDGTAYVKTGDIPAEWLRDSSAQLRPYILLAKKDPALAKLIKGVIIRQARYLSVDPYANAFRSNYRIWEEKFELDSLAYPITLAWTYWKTAGDASVFTAEVAKGYNKDLQTMLDEQHHATSPRRYDHYQLNHSAVAYTGMIWTGFRPSDDACTYHYLIPSEMMAVVALNELADIEQNVWHDRNKARRARKLARQVSAGIQKYGIVTSPKHGRVYAYEVDGLGHYTLTDDSNIPSLLSAPYLGYLSASDKTYLNTRRFLLSKSNPYYYVGTYAHGIGSPHTPAGYIWPLALLAQAFTATNQKERQDAIAGLLASDPGDGKLHESFDPNNPKKFTRPDFGWPNALFAEYVLTHDMGYRPLPLPKIY